MAYTPLSSTNPVGTQTGTAVSDSARTNDLALRDAILMGAMDGFVFSQSNTASGTPTTTVAQPAYWFWKNGALWLRATVTWGAGTGTDGNPTTIVWALSINSGTDYTTAPGGAIDTQTFSWSTAGDLTATTGSGSTSSVLVGLLGKFKVLKAAYDAHAAAGIATVHSAGTMAAQAAGSVAITGGTINATTVGLTTPADGAFTRATESVNTLQTPGSGAAVALDWAKGASRVTNNGTNAVSFSNVAATGIATHLVYVSNFNGCTWPASLPTGNWGAAGKPSFATAAWVSLWSHDGGTTVYGAIAWK
jgi:hypothetical protein